MTAFVRRPIPAPAVEAPGLAGEGRFERLEDRSELLWGRAERAQDIDEFARCAIGRAEEIRDLFVPRFFFGCEGGDPPPDWLSTLSVVPLARASMRSSAPISATSICPV